MDFLTLRVERNKDIASEKTGTEVNGRGGGEFQKVLQIRYSPLKLI